LQGKREPCAPSKIGKDIQEIYRSFLFGLGIIVLENKNNVESSKMKSWDICDGQEKTRDNGLKRSFYLKKSIR